MVSSILYYRSFILRSRSYISFFFFFNDTATTEIYTLSLHDALPIYARDSLTSYVSGGHVQYGWQPLYDHYQTTYFAPGKRRDSLAFAEVRVRPLTLDLALCTARFRLSRGDSVTASGPFTLLLQKRGGRWQILHDHTSADAK